MFFENLKLALKSMWANKMRTVLSLLGIVIGVTAVVAILTLGQSATASITDSLESGGLNTLSISVASGQKNTDTFDEVFGDTLMKNIEGLDNVIPLNSSSARVRYKQTLKSGSLYGVPSNYANEMDYEVDDGSWFTPEDNITKRQVVVLGADLAEDLFPEGNAVGQYVSIFRSQSKRYLVVGVMKEKDPTLSGTFNSSMFIPYNTFTQRFTRVNNVGTYIVKVNQDYDPIEVGDNITDFLDDLVGSKAYTLISTATLSEIAGDISGTFSTFLAAIAGISLVVGGIGIMNIMLVSVAERTKEIGIRKALGAAPKIIRGQFITEAIVLSLLGGALGILLGTELSYIVTRIAGWGFKISIKSYVISVGFSALIGIFFGWYPAKQASKLDPIIALNYE